MTKQAYLAALRAALLERYGKPGNGIESWACDTARLDRFLEHTKSTISSPVANVNIDGPAFVDAWHAIGKKGRPTYKALRALPEAEDLIAA